MGVLTKKKRREERGFASIFLAYTNHTGGGESWGGGGKVCAKSYPCKFKAALAPLQPKMRNKQQLPECKTRFSTQGSEKILHTNQEQPNSNFLWSLSSQYSTLHLGRRSKKDTEARNVAHPDIEIQVSYRLLPFPFFFFETWFMEFLPPFFAGEQRWWSSVGLASGEISRS